MSKPRKTNYHTHTARCNHAVGTDEAYVRSAIKAGYTELGFSDHTPWPYASGYRATMRMQPEELEGYVQSVRGLKEKYAESISIKLALECEYFPDYIGWLQEMAAAYQMDYLLFGNHFYPTDESGPYYGAGKKNTAMLHQYVASAEQALASGMFAYFAHPDLFMRGQPQFGAEEKAVSRALCQLANQYHLPVEYNLAGELVSRASGRVGYPHPDFWRIAAEENCTVIIGADAHDNHYLEDDTLEREGRAFLLSLGLKLTDEIGFRTTKGNAAWG